MTTTFATIADVDAHCRQQLHARRGAAASAEAVAALALIDRRLMVELGFAARAARRDARIADQLRLERHIARTYGAA